MQFHFFAYGAFDYGHVHFPKISNFIVGKRPALVRGDLYLLQCGYPMLVVGNSTEFVEGNLLELEAPESFLPTLDQLIGYDLQKPGKSFFLRHSVEAYVDNYSKIDTFLYGLNPSKISAFHKKITGSGWKNHMIANPPLSQKLAVRQKNYIKKLSQSKGRDIVPIKLDLYRELSSLDIVVDKGRRLALTSLGRETAHFL